MAAALEINCLSVFAGFKKVVSSASLELGGGELHVLLGPNGAGKSSLANAVMGRYDLRVEGRVYLWGEDVTRIPTHEKARKGLVMAVQNPPELEGVRVGELLARIAGSPRRAAEALRSLGLDEGFLSRWFMVGMSGGERKRLELARVMLLKPRVALLDEPDSGIDVDSLRLVAGAIRALAASGAAVLVITHQPSFARRLAPSRVHVMVDGHIVAEGGQSLLEELEETGYSAFPLEAKGC